LGEVELTRMSSRGQIVIPQDIREELGLVEGEAFAVFGSKDSLFLKRIKTPSKKEMLEKFEELVKKGEEKAKKLGIKEKDVSKLIHKGRGIKG